MYENMVGPVGLAMHEDRLAQATKNRRLTEAEAGRRTAAEKVYHGYRETARRLLLTLAVRIAPRVALRNGYILATGR